jgi:porin
MEFPVYSYADAIPVPLYPTGGLGLRLRYAPNDRWSFQTAIFDGDPYAPGRGLNPHGTHLRLAAHDGATLAAELALNLGVAPGSALPPGTWKLGAYHNTRLYPDVTTGSLHRGNLSGYVNGDHTLWQENPSKKDDAQGLALYAIAEWAQSDRNTYRHGFGGGPYYTGVFPGRDRDVAYLNVLYTRFSPRYAAASRAAGGPHYGVETRWQFNYQIVLTPYFSLTPEINYVVSPGGTGRVPHTTVFGLRSKLSL